MAAIDLITIGSTDDAETTAFQNKLTIRKAADLFSLGGKSGILKGWAYAVVAGQMQLSVAVGAGVVQARDASQVEQDWGWVAQTRVATVVQFAAASAGNRKDALVFASCDPQEAGTFPGTGGLSAGGHLVSVPGTSGVTTALTDAAIAAYLGSGGFHRIADVLIPSGTTQISAGNVTFTGFKINDWNELSLSPSAGWSAITRARYIRHGTTPMVRIRIFATKSGSTITAGSDGNFGDVTVTTGIPAALRPVADTAYGNFFVTGVHQGSARIETGGDVVITDAYPNATIVSGNEIRIDFDYPIV